ncbi:MAG: ABC transporter ATP-binding protein [Candidatus Hodarchaeales archaeon]|jgi:putative ABC transport system ATP-binding protein
MSVLAIEALDLQKEFDMGETKVHALNGVSLKVKKGEFVVILGPSGSGKTTLLNQIGGIDLTELNMVELTDYRRDKVGWMFQFFNLIPSLSAWENVGLALEFQGMRDGVRDKAIEILERVGLGDKIDRFPAQLSGGEQQRVAIARALVKNPEIIVADEPTGNLDWSTGQTIANLMKTMNKELGLTFVVVSHDISITEEADRVYHLRDGKITHIDEETDSIGVEKAPTGIPSRKKVTDD